MIIFYFILKIITNENCTTIREQLGISQQVLTIYLSIRLSQLALYETSKRELPVGTTEKLVDILLFLNKKIKQEKELLNKQQSKVQILIEMQFIELELKQIKTSLTHSIVSFFRKGKV